MAGYVIGGRVMSAEVSSARITSRGNKIWQFKQWCMLTTTISLQIIATWGLYYLATIPVQIVLLNEGYHYQTQSLFEIKQAEYIGVQ